MVSDRIPKPLLQQGHLNSELYGKGLIVEGMFYSELELPTDKTQKTHNLAVAFIMSDTKLKVVYDTISEIHL